jgi:hypothetical protein
MLKLYVPEYLLVSVSLSHLRPEQQTVSELQYTSSDYEGE